MHDADDMASSAVAITVTNVEDTRNGKPGPDAAQRWRGSNLQPWKTWT